MNKLIKNINEKKYELIYYLIWDETKRELKIDSLDFIFECNHKLAYGFLEFCIEQSNNKVFRLKLCELISYGDIYYEKENEIISEQIMLIMKEDMSYVPALEYILYNFFENPNSPFSNRELEIYAKELLKYSRDSLALKIVNENYK